MTNHPSNHRFRDLVRNAPLPTNGARVQPMASAPIMVQFDPIHVADRILTAMQVGAPFPIDQQNLIPLPDYADIGDKFEAHVNAQDGGPTADNLTHLAMLRLLARAQAEGKAIFDAFRARHAAPMAEPDALPEAPEWKPKLVEDEPEDDAP